MPDFKEISYVVDPHDHLVEVNQEWTPFALKNEGYEAVADQVVGRSLWEFITDDPTRELYAAILEHVRSGETTELVLRCDGPERRRLIELIITPRPDGNVQFKTLLLASKPRAAQPLFARSTPRDGRRVMVCSWCDMVNVDVEKWFEVEAAMEYLQLTEEPELPSIDPVVCPACYTKITELLARPPAPRQEPPA
jgi:hypothetical protein